jgi:hypothetical protein
MPLGFPPEAVESALSYRPAPDDIFVASYPKSGTTWLQYIVYLLIRRRPIGPDESLTDCFPHLEEVGARAVERLPRPRLLKTHLALDMAPWSQTARYIVIARNPFDCAVSFFHHTHGFPRHYDFAEGTFAEYFEVFIAGEVDFGDYFDHLLSWLAVANDDNVLFLTYESLKRAPRETIARIAAFLGETALASIADASDLDRLVEESSLDAMRRDQQRWSSLRPDWATPFVRKGEIGDWRASFTPGQTRALLAKFDQRLGGTEAEALWQDLLSAARAWAEADVTTAR